MLVVYDFPNSEPSVAILAQAVAVWLVARTHRPPGRGGQGVLGRWVQRARGCVCHWDDLEDSGVWGTPLSSIVGCGPGYIDRALI